MGIGDELMLGGEARRLAAGRPLRYRMLDKRGEPRWHFVWEGHPNIARPEQPHDGEIGFCAGKRPYIEDVRPDRYIFRPYSPAPGWVRLGPQAQNFARIAAGAVVFNPNIKDRASPNKNWGLDQWRALIRLLPDLRWIQIGEPGGATVRNVERLFTPNFSDACGALSSAAAIVLQEGALHHAAAALGKPAIVIRGGFISPKVTGYAGQVDFYVESDEYPLGCGMRKPCDHCKDAMASITPESVAKAVRTIINHQSSPVAVTA